ncbi:hypothetical protein H9X96_11710 [Pedobacter sp. N36a]|nr:hypothetical protein [Pedobacter sp. N36a]MBC8986444.1 hypothetical protein [Pedobacter sp. N36a]
MKNEENIPQLVALAVFSEKPNLAAVQARAFICRLFVTIAPIRQSKSNF